MPVYKHNYRAYAGKTTSAWSRILVLSRYGLNEAWSSKITVGLVILCYLPCIVSIFGIYLVNNPTARLLVGNMGPRDIEITARYFLNVMMVQCWMALALAAWVAPRLISFDLSDNALPILLSHPISRFGYVFGKFIASFSALSVVTLIPCLLLFAYQGYSSATPWVVANLYVAGGMLAGTVIWIAFLSLLGLAISSWVKWRVVATGAILASVFVPAGIGAIFSAVLRSKWGLLLNIPYMMSALWERLLRVETSFNSRFALPIEAIVGMLILVCFVCAAMLNARIRAREVLRG